MDGTCSTLGDRRVACRALVGKSEGDRPLLKQPLAGENIKKCLKEIGWEDMGWIDLAQDRHKWWWWVGVGVVMTILVP
jgi:hypothetical protein